MPIDACYELVGELRRLWKGFDGGTEAHEAMDAFFDRLRERSAMTDLDDLGAVGASPTPTPPSPTLLLRLRIEAPEAEPVHAMVLKAQIRIEPQRRRYSPEEEQRLVELFGEAPRWGETLQAVPVDACHRRRSPSSPASIEVDLPVPCTYDFEVAAAKYLHSIGDGEIPIVLLFSGTVFSFRDGGLVVQPIAWNVEAEHRLPVAVWRATMDSVLPEQRLDPPPHARRSTPSPGYKADRALTSWEDTFERLLKEAGP